VRTEVVVEEGASIPVVEAVVEPLLFALARRAELRVMRGMVFGFSVFNRFR